MNRSFLLALCLLSALSCFSQIHYEKGYFIDASGQKLECLIKNIQWKNNPSRFEYKLSENSEELKATIATVTEFAIYNDVKFIRATVNIDRSIQTLADMTVKRNPEYQRETLFLRVIVQGKADLYEFVDETFEYYFFKMPDSEIEQLVYKRYLVSTDNIAENNDFRQQLARRLNCTEIKVSEFKPIDYQERQLKNLFVKYNKCQNSEYADLDEGNRKYGFDLTVRPGITSSRLRIDGGTVRNSEVDFGKMLTFRLGMEGELILPFNKNKWSIIVEPTYRYYNSEKVSNSTRFKVNYHSIELPVGFRYNVFLNDKSKLFVNAGIVFDFAGNSRVDINSTDKIDIKTEVNYAFGIGYKFAYRYSFEFRYFTSRNVVFSQYFISDYDALSLVVGYSLFKPKK